MSHKNQWSTIRRQSHSLHPEKRSEAIRLLGQMSDAESSRELVQIFEDCQWRNTKFEILKALSQHRNSRAFEFLVRMALQKQDLPISLAAIEALGNHATAPAKRFLEALFRNGDPTLLPTIVASLAQSLDRNPLPDIEKALATAIKESQSLYRKSLVLAVGELKGFESLAALRTLASESNSGDLSLAALISIGKLSRDPEDLADCEENFLEDPLRRQIFQSVKSQITLRSRWKVEDYLQRFYESPLSHPSLPLELNSFSKEEVSAGLELFAKPENLARTVSLLSHLTDAAKLFKQTLKPESLDEENFQLVLKSIQNHFDQNLQEFLVTLRASPIFETSDAAFETWIETALLTLVDPTPVLEPVLNDFSQIPIPRQMAILNQLGQAQTAFSPDRKSLGLIQKLIVQMESQRAQLPPQIQARWIRLTAEAVTDENILSKILIESMKSDETLLASLNVLERRPLSKLKTPLENLSSRPPAPALDLAVLRVLKSYGDSKLSQSFADLLTRSLKPSAEASLRAEALKVLGATPLEAFERSAVDLLVDSATRLQAVITLKSYKSESLADSLKPLLKESDESLVGRTLDTLLSLDGSRGTRLAIDRLLETPEDFDLAEKVLRSLDPDSKVAEYAANQFRPLVSQLKSPNVLSLYQNFLEGASLGAGSLKLDPEATKELDASLTKALGQYNSLDESVKVALRSGELPVQHQDLYPPGVDKSQAILALTKALDLHLEKILGRKFLARAEKALHEFQNRVHLVGLAEDSPNNGRVLTLLGLEKDFTPQSLPVHKMSLVSRDILNGRVLNESFKTLDGLRAWAVVLLIFCRSYKSNGSELKALLPLPETLAPQITSIARRLMALQDLRNPAAHRQTILDMTVIEKARTEVFELINLFRST